MKALNRLLAGLAIAILAISTVAQRRTTTSVPSVERLRSHVEYLASDKLEGRRTGTAGANLAAEYIAREFSRYGLRRSIGYDTAGMSILDVLKVFATGSYSQTLANAGSTFAVLYPPTR